jgi:hypothetical protein
MRRAKDGSTSKAKITVAGVRAPPSSTAARERAMLKPWFNILPLFIVKMIARRKCEVFDVQGVPYHGALRDVLIRSKDHG